MKRKNKEKEIGVMDLIELVVNLIGIIAFYSIPVLAIAFIWNPSIFILKLGGTAGLVIVLALLLDHAIEQNG